MNFSAKYSPSQYAAFEADAKTIAASATIRKQATAAVERRSAAKAAIDLARRRRQEVTSGEVRLARRSEPPISRSDLRPHLRGQWSVSLSAVLIPSQLAPILGLAVRCSLLIQNSVTKRKTRLLKQQNKINRESCSAPTRVLLVLST